MTICRWQFIVAFPDSLLFSRQWPRRSRHLLTNVFGVMREVSQNPTPSGSRKKMRLLRKRTSRPSLTQNREIGHFLLLNAAS